jgi:organic radical activating enzyme
MDFLKRFNLPDPVCLYKWNWSTIRLLEGTSSSCHRVKADSITHENYHNFHNTENKIKDRQKMLDGIWPGKGCEYCKRIEDVGGISDRLKKNKRHNEKSIPPETFLDSRSIKLTPTTVEVYFNNLCNMGCIYCSSMYSTLWEAEDKKFNTRLEDIEFLEETRKLYPLRVKAHWKWMEENAHNVLNYHVLGGEPFFQKEFYDNIEFFKNHPCPDTNVVIFSNLKVNNNKLKNTLNEIVDLINQKHIGSFTIYCSFDCWGKQQEYIRYGLNLNQWENNFLTILKEYPQINLIIHSTIISLTLPTLYKLCHKVTKWKKIRDIHHNLSLADGRPEMDIGIFPKYYFKDFFDLARKNTVDKNALSSLHSFEKVADSTDENLKLIKNLKNTLDITDSRRNTNWKKLWPWLDKFNTNNADE